MSIKNNNEVKMIAKIIIDMKLISVVAAIGISLSASTASFAMEDHSKNTPASQNVFTYKCKKNAGLKGVKIKKIFKKIAEINNQKKAINILEITNCSVSYKKAKHLARGAEQYDLIDLLIPANNKYTLTYNPNNRDIPMRRWRVQRNKNLTPTTEGLQSNRRNSDVYYSTVNNPRGIPVGF